MGDTRTGTTAAPRRLALVVALVGLAAGPIACEHARTWRGAEPRSPGEITKLSDPDHAHSVLLATMAPPAPAEPHDEATILAHSAGCMSCHGETDDADMHVDLSVGIGCTDCHGGDASVMTTLAAPGRPGEPGAPIEDEAYLEAMLKAHVQPRNPEAWYGATLASGRAFGEHDEHHGKHGGALHGSANPEITYAALNHESPEFIRFINPGDLRVADWACGSCHGDQVAKVRHGMMAHGAMLWGAALYNNGSITNKIPRFGESYSPFGIPQRLQGVVETRPGEGGATTVSVRNPTQDEMDRRGVLPALDPLPVWNISQPGNVLRIFERGTKLPIPGTTNPAEPGNPNVLVEGGRPDKGLSPRGLGTLNRTDPVFLGLQKTRLLDPILYFLGTNDHAGDFRSSGCTACHTVYANDRDPYHSGPFAMYGNDGFSASVDPTLPKDRKGHPIRHELTNAIPNSQCVVCHIHPGTSYANTYLGYMWWDNESDGDFMYPAQAQTISADEEWLSFMKNPEAASKRGLWGDLHPDARSHRGDVAGEDFLARSGRPRGTGENGPTLNDRLEHNQFADFHGHGWIFRAVFKKDRQGNLLDENDALISYDDPDKWAKAVHLRDVHLERGMHCVDCHFTQDVHGDGHLYGETRNAIEITCQDCHGSYTERATLMTSGPAAREGGRDLSRDRVFGKRRFEWDGDTLTQRSTLDPEKSWVVPQTIDTINPGSAWSLENPQAAERSRYAKTVRRDGSWGDLPKEGDGSVPLAHPETTLECYTCHTSWMTSCFGCHLPMQANRRTPTLHNEGLYTRNYTQYNYQVLRDDVFMLGRDGSVKGGRIVPVRSSSAVLVSSQNANREWVYSQQQTVSGEGYSGQVFNPHFPHATSGRGTTKRCTDCHVSEANDNNAWMAQLLLQGTNFVNFLGRYVYVAEGEHGVQAVVATERDEPQAVLGSRLHELAYPDRAEKFESADARTLRESHHHDAGFGGAILDLQLRGEYLYTARGPAGFYAYDVANIDNKGFSERIVTAPVSPLGQRLGFRTKNAVAIASPSTLAVDPARTRLSSDPSKPRAIGMDEPQPWHVNQEQAIHPLYAYLYIGDSEEGLILTNAATLLDGEPRNNFLERAALDDGTDAFNPEGLLTGLTSLTVVGERIYATSASGLVSINIDTPLSPRVEAVVGSDSLRDPRSVGVQFRYAFITDADGLKVVDVTDPLAPSIVPGALVPLEDARRLYVSRTRVFVAAGRQGLAIIDITNPEQPRLEQRFDAGGEIDDAHDVKVGMTNASLFAYIADGHNGLRVVRLMGPESTPRFRGFSPPLQPALIATAPTDGPALAISEGLDRDRAVDESGNQVAVFGRLGARPLTLEEMQRLYLRDGALYTVTDDPTTEPADFTFEGARPAAEEEAPSESGRRRRRGG